MSSVGWLGAVAVFLALAIAGLTAQDAQVVRAVYLGMDAVGWYALVPLSLASLVTGLVQSLAGKWGLFRHYWVVMKLAINVVATIVLLLYMETLSNLARVAREAGASGGVGGLSSPSPVLHSAAALLLLLVATTLSVYKPTGVTRYGQRKQHERRPPRTPRGVTPRAPPRG